MCTRYAAFLLSLFLLVPATLVGQIPEGFEGAFEPHPEAEEAIDQLFSPFCPGFMLDVCTARESQILRDSMNTLAYQGWSSGEIVDWMIADYGEQYRAVPQNSGWGVWAWILPPFVLLLGAGLVVVTLRRFDPRRSAENGGAGGEREEKAVSIEEEERLRSAIREIELREDPSL